LENLLEKPTLSQPAAGNTNLRASNEVHQIEKKYSRYRERVLIWMISYTKKRAKEDIWAKEAET
jgi:hypothetical protein